MEPMNEHRLVFLLGLAGIITPAQCFLLVRAPVVEPVEPREIVGRL
jgi:hypothetical protein